MEGLKSDILLGATMFFSAMGYLSVEKTTKIVAAQLLIFGCKVSLIKIKRAAERKKTYPVHGPYHVGLALLR